MQAVQSHDLSDAFPDDRLALLKDQAPEVYARLRDTYELAARAAPPELLALARLRLTEIIEPQVGSARAPDAGTDAERACLAFTEQFAISVADVNDALIDDLLAVLSADEVYGLVYGVYVIDAVQRLATTLHRVFDGR